MSGEKSGTVRSARVTRSGFALLLGMTTLWGCGTEGLTAPEAMMGDSLRTAQQALSYGDHTYVFSTTAKNWLDAAKACADLDMGLVTFDDAAEEQWVRSQLPAPGEWWIGFNDRAIEGTWTWAGAPSTSTYTHWKPGEPNAAYTTEDCALSDHIGWNDAACTMVRPFACESLQVKPAQFNGHAYLFYTQMKPWAQAQATCRSQGYDLVTINDSAEDAWLKTQVPAGLASWIGFSDQAQEGVWRWSDGAPVTYTNWRRYEPNNTGSYEHCAVNNAPPVGSTPGGGWNDIHCGEYASFICEQGYPPEGYGYFFYEATGTASATQGTTPHEFWLEAGATLEIGTCGLPEATASGDTFLRLEGADGLEVSANDDDCKGSGSRIRYRVPACGAGTYVLKAGCFENGACAGRVVYRILPPEPPQP